MTSIQGWGDLFEGSRLEGVHWWLYHVSVRVVRGCSKTCWGSWGWNKPHSYQQNLKVSLFKIHTLHEQCKLLQPYLRASPVPRQPHLPHHPHWRHGPGHPRHLHTVLGLHPKVQSPRRERCGEFVTSERAGEVSDCALLPLRSAHSMDERSVVMGKGSSG